ncbi:adenylate/guanylate cyclase domain-containing protein [Bacteroides fragilis]|nr:adenylate/guanylate cyclase domain-containing protein [Bacteroides fragilis]
MPNLQQVIALRKKYDSQQPISDSADSNSLEKQGIYEELEKAITVKHIGPLLEHVIPREEYFSITDESLSSSIINYFEEQKEENVVLLFIDITNFSRKTSGFSPKRITTILDRYYRQLMPIIYRNGGEIEKIMGDGIICIFGEPFLKGLSTRRKYIKAERCARDVIVKFKDSDFEVKVALHSGSIMYYKTPTEYYEEYTMIGNTLTELYRLESVSQSNGINFFEDRGYDLESEYATGGINLARNYWQGTSMRHNLQGLGYRTIKALIRK